MAEMRLDFTRRLLMFVCVCVVCMFVAAAAMALVTHGGLTARTLRLATVIQDLMMFVVPPVVCALLFTRLPASYLRVDAPPGALMTVVALGALLSSIPMMNCVIEWNAGLSLPPALASVEAWMRHAEEQAAEAVGMLMGGSGVSSLIVSVMIVGVLAGLSEELFFRGGVQRLLSSRPMNIHLAVWLTAILFSAIHLQFFGFFPRLLLGAYFGYLLYWSGSLWLPVICHVVNNSLVVAATWLEARGTSSGVLHEVGTSASGAPQWLYVAVSALLTLLLLLLLRRLAHPRPSDQ